MMKIEFREVSFSYPDNPVLDSVNITIGTSCFVCLIGLNGMGKTTLIDLISDKLKPISGEILMERDDGSYVEANSVENVFALIPQGINDPMYLTVRETVSMARFDPRAIWKIRLSEHDETIITESIELCGISDKQDRTFFELSGGEKQRVWLAFCLAQDKDILILDESLHALDFPSRIFYFHLLSSLAASGKGILLSTHEIALAERYADRIIALRDGHIVYDGPPIDNLASLI
jgi:iron complex transport system ATP-binding protein